MRRLTILLLATIAAACGGSMPPAPSAAISVSLPPTVPSQTVTCTTCVQPPLTVQVADFAVTVADPAGRGGTVASVDAVVRDVRRNMDLGRTRIPNAAVGLPNGSVPASGTLSVAMGVTFDTAPALSDAMQLTVTVTLTDGRTGTASAIVAAT